MARDKSVAALIGSKMSASKAMKMRTGPASRKRAAEPAVDDDDATVPSAKKQSPSERRASRERARARREKRAMKRVLDAQKHGGLLTPRAPFRRYVRTVANEMNGEPVRFNKDAFDLIQESVERDVMAVAVATKQITRNAKRTLLSPEDVHCAVAILSS